MHENNWPNRWWFYRCYVGWNLPHNCYFEFVLMIVNFSTSPFTPLPTQNKKNKHVISGPSKILFRLWSTYNHDFSRLGYILSSIHSGNMQNFTHRRPCKRYTGISWREKNQKQKKERRKNLISNLIH
jgi:hypothetical protein